MTEIRNQKFDKERALYGLRGVSISGCDFSGPEDGESPLKECSDLSVTDSRFDLRYPFWHNEKGTYKSVYLSELCRAAFWYDMDIVIENSVLNGVKALRECTGAVLRGCEAKSTEFGWKCCGVVASDLTLESEYPFFMSEDLEFDRLKLKGKYSFQYVEDCVIRNSVLDTKDAFWHSKNVTVYDSVIKGEYLAWYSENLRLVRCRISGTQPFCCAEGLVLEDCTLEGADFAFEKSDVRADLKGSVISIRNPKSGRIELDEVEELLGWDGSCELLIRSGKKPKYTEE